MKKKKVFVNRLEYFIGWSFLKVVHRFKVLGKDNLPKSGPLIIVANHSSYYDPPVVDASVYPLQVNFMAKSELFKVPLLSSYIRKLGAFPIKRKQFDRQALSTALDKLRSGQIIAIFPQGTRSTKQVFQGAVFLANKTGAPIIPLHILGTDMIMPKGRRLPRLAKIIVRIGKPMSVNFAGKDEAASFSDKIMKEIYNL